MIDNPKIAVVAYVSSKGCSAQLTGGERIDVVFENVLREVRAYKGRRRPLTWRSTEWAIPSGRQSRSRDGLSRWVYVALASTWGWLAIGAPAWATHEVNHRFEVTGTIRAADGIPRPNLKVVVSHPRSNLSESALTDGSGRYAVLLHLHDKDAGDPVTVTAGEETTTIRADYDPKDHRTRRLVTVDFGPTVQSSQGSDAQSRSMMWWYGAGGAALAGSVIYWRLRAMQLRRAAKTGRSARRKAKSHV